MKAIYKRELASYLKSPIGYVFVGIFLLISGYFFVMTNLAYRIDDISYIFSNMGIVLLFVVPFLTMRLIAEERHAKTDQLLLTSPVSRASIILGKYFAAVTVYAISLGIMLVYPVILLVFGEPPIGPMISIFFGFLLMGSSLIALGVFASSITENQIIAAIVTFASLLLLWLIGSVTGLTTNVVIVTLVEQLAVLTRFEEFVYGQMTLPTILYFISFAAIFLFLATVKLDGTFIRKWGKKLPICCGIIAVIVLLNVGLSFATDKFSWNLKWDITQEKVYTLSDESKEILSSLDKDINIIVFAAPEQQDSTVNNIVDRYAMASSRVTTQKIDPEANPLLTQKYVTMNDEISSGSVVVECGDKFKVLDNYDLYDSTNGYYADIFQGEDKITGAILSVIAEKTATIGVLTGHGGKVTEDTSLAQLLSERGYEIKETNTILGDIPEDIDLLMIVAPKTDLSESEIDSIDAFLASGKAMQVYLDYDTPDLPNLQGYLADSWGAEYQRNVVVETDNSLVYNRYPTFLVPNLGYHEITEKLISNGISTIAPSARQVKILDNDSEEILYTVTPLMTTSDKSYAKVNMNATSSDREVGDVSGPIDVAVISAKETSSVLMAGTAYMVDSSILYYDKDFILNAISWQTNTGVPLVVMPKYLAPGALEMSQTQLTVCMLLVLIVIPLAVLIAGLLVWIKRRRK